MFDIIPLQKNTNLNHVTHQQMPETGKLFIPPVGAAVGQHQGSTEVAKHDATANIDRL